MESKSSNLFKTIVALALTMAVMLGTAKSFDVTDHNKIVSCYVGTWAFYR